jgi:hypothetical protein
MSPRVKYRITFAPILLIAALAAGAQSASNDAAKRKSSTREYWADPDTGLMWAGRDSGKDLSWKAAFKYCRDLRLTGYSDWRLANMAELQGIYDRTAEAPGLAGMHSEEPTSWHVKGSLFLIAYEWSSNYRMNGRGRPNSYAYYFDFNAGKPNDDPTGWPYSFSFRRAGDPLGGQRKH